MRRRMHALAVALLLPVLLCMAGGAQAAIRNVCPAGGTYSTIAAAISAASPGDTIRICPGTYNGAINVSKANLILESSTGNRNDVTLTNNNVVLSISGPNTTVRNLTVVSQNNTAIDTEWAASGSHLFENLVVQARQTAITISNGGAQTFRNLEVSSANGGGIELVWNVDGGHIFDGVTISSRNQGIWAVRGAAQIRNANVTTSNGIGIQIGNKYAGVYENIVVDSADTAFHIVHQENESPAHIMSDLELVSRNNRGLYVARSGKLTVTNLKVTANRDGVYLDSNSTGAHEFRNVEIVSATAKGMVADRGAGLLQNLSVEAQGMALDIGNLHDVTLTGISVSSHNATAINFNNNAAVGASYTLKNVTVEKAGGTSSDGLYFHTATNTPSVSIDNICVRSAGRHGINFHWNAVNVNVTNSIFRGQAQYGVYMGANPAHDNHVNNSCFYTPRCAYASEYWGVSNHDFSGNFWGPGLPACNNTNVIANTPLASCPIPENVCYSSTIGVPPAPGGLNAFETTTGAGAIDGVIKTKIAGAAFNLDVVALNQARDGVATSFTGDVKVEILGNHALAVPLDANNCPQSAGLQLALPAPLAFAAGDAGRKTVAIPAIPDAWRDVRLRLSYPATGTPSVVACSTDNFAIRPAALGNVNARDAGWETAGSARLLNNASPTGGVVHKAGRPFALFATAVNAVGDTTVNYNGLPTVRTLACTLPTPACVNGTLTPGSWSGAGTVSTSTARYSEAGSFNLVLEDATFASVDNKPGDSSPTEYTVAQTAAVSIGRFVPDHFHLQASGVPRLRTFDAHCTETRSFTYIGQPFGYALRPQATITARNHAGTTTRNYSRNLWKLEPADVAQTYAASMPLDPPVVNNPSVSATSGNAGTGLLLVSANDALSFTRDPATPQPPFNADISLSLTVSDDSEAGLVGQGVIGTASPLVFNGTGSGIEFDAGNEFRYGRLRVSSQHGSDLLPLPVAVSTQYWNGTHFIRNNADHCTAIAAANIRFDAYAGGLNSTNMPHARIQGDVALRNGDGRIMIAPPAPGPVTGSVDLCIDLGPDSAGIACSASASANLPWLQGGWTQPHQSEDPRGRATFGRYKSGVILDLREIF